MPGETALKYFGFYDFGVTPFVTLPVRQNASTARLDSGSATAVPVAGRCKRQVRMARPRDGLASMLKRLDPTSVGWHGTLAIASGPCRSFFHFKDEALEQPGRAFRRGRQPIPARQLLAEEPAQLLGQRHRLEGADPGPAGIARGHPDTRKEQGGGNAQGLAEHFP
ncbi:hypothetical protein D9M68_616950 [compost metagenome]